MWSKGSNNDTEELLGLIYPSSDVLVPLLQLLWPTKLRPGRPRQNGEVSCRVVRKDFFGPSGSDPRPLPGYRFGKHLDDKSTMGS